MIFLFALHVWICGGSFQKCQAKALITSSNRHTTFVSRSIHWHCCLHFIDHIETDFCFHDSNWKLQNCQIANKQKLKFPIHLANSAKSRRTSALKFIGTFFWNREVKHVTNYKFIPCKHITRLLINNLSFSLSNTLKILHF